MSILHTQWVINEEHCNRITLAHFGSIGILSTTGNLFAPLQPETDDIDNGTHLIKSHEHNSPLNVINNKHFKRTSSDKQV